MIYVTISPYPPKSILRISYISDEEGVEKIKADLGEYNPSSEILYVIKDGTMKDLEKIYEFFKHYRLGLPGGWWFEYNKNILDFFDLNNTIESIRKEVR